VVDFSQGFEFAVVEWVAFPWVSVYRAWELCCSEINRAWELLDGSFWLIKKRKVFSLE